jgi:hypothetical protein
MKFEEYLSKMYKKFLEIGMSEVLKTKNAYFGKVRAENIPALELAGLFSAVRTLFTK